MDIREAAVQLLLLLSFVHADKLPSYLTKCPSRERAKFKACALENARSALAFLGSQGDKKYGFSAADPVNFPLIETDNNGFVLKFIDLNISTDPPLSYKIDDVDLDLERRHLDLFYSAPAVVMKSKYETDGRILILPVKGDGDAELRVEGYKAHYFFDFDVVKSEKDGLDHIKLKNSNYTSDASKVTYNFTNLFNGEKTLGKATIDFLNENWKEVFEETKWSTFEAIRQFLTVQFQSFFDRVPYQEAFP